MKKNLFESFRGLYLDENNMSSYKNYYNALVQWVKDNSRDFGRKPQELSYWNSLKLLFDLDLDVYMVDDPDIPPLDSEKSRIYKIIDSPKMKIDGLLMIIRDVLWDMVTIRSNKKCIYCNCSDLRYIKVNFGVESMGEVILECTVCGNVMDVDGLKYEGSIENYYPASKEEVMSMAERCVFD